MNRELPAHEQQPPQRKIGRIRRCLRAIDEWASRASEADLAYRARHESAWVMPPAPVPPHVEGAEEISKIMDTPGFQESFGRALTAVKEADLTDVETYQDYLRAVSAKYEELYPADQQQPPRPEVQG